jgi:O-methyltransferase
MLIGAFPDETGSEIAGNRFRLCHIDVDVYESARATLDWVWPRMPAGGVIIFDDYGFLSTSGITRLVNEERGKPDRIIIHNLNGHGLLIKIRE